MTRRLTLALAALWLLIASAAFVGTYLANAAHAASRPAAQLPASTAGHAPDPSPVVRVGQRTGAPWSTARAPHGQAIPSPSPVATETPGRGLTPGRTPTPSVQASLELAGVATWYRGVPGQAAAGPALRAALGPGWRGRDVLVCATSAGEQASSTVCARVQLTDWCACMDRPGGPTLVDLDRRTFALLAAVGRGVVTVWVTP